MHLLPPQKNLITAIFFWFLRFTTDLNKFYYYRFYAYSLIFAKKKYANLRETSGNFPDIFHIRRWRWQRPSTSAENQESMPRQSWTGGVIRWLIVALLTSETPIYITEKKTNPKKDAHICFFLFFLFGMLKQHDRAVFFCETMWKAVKQWFFLTSLSRMVATRRSEKATCECREAPDARRHGVAWRRWSWRREDGDASEALGSRNQLRHRRQNMAIWMQYDAKDGNSSITWFQLEDYSNSNFATEIFCGRMLHWDFSACQAPARELRW